MGCCGSRPPPASHSSVRQFSISSSGSENDITFINNTRDDITYITTARLDTVEEVEEVEYPQLEYSLYLSNQAGRGNLPTSAILPIREMMRRKREEIREESNRLTNSLTSPIVDGGIESKYAGFQSKTHAS
jgi:hypothetical protein